MKAPAAGTLTASAAVVTAGNLASRGTGFLRVLAVGAALGTTFLGNTYQAANLVSNLLFELVAAGLLSSVLVPPFTRLVAAGDRGEAERLAGAVLGVALVVLGALTVAGILARPWIMRLLTLAVEDPVIRRQEVALGSFLLVLFLPQLVLYAVGSVATALLHGSRRFAAAAFAPVANNLTVIATMVVFWVLAGGAPVGLELSGPERLVLGVGTTAGVAAMTAVPLIALRRSGLSVRPRLDLRHPMLGRLLRDGAWAAGGLALAQVLVATTLVLANRIEGGVVAYHIAFQAFLLPFALLAHPVITTTYPRLVTAGPPAAAARRTADGARTLVFLLVPATALLVVLAGPAARALELGAIDRAGVVLVGRVLAAYALGLVGYAGLHYLTRAFYAVGDARTPTLVMAGVALGGSLLMVGWFSAVDGPDRVVAVALAHSVACAAGTAALAVALRRRAHREPPGAGGQDACGEAAGGEAGAAALGPGPSLGAALARATVAGAAAASVAAAAAWVVPVAGRAGALLDVAVAASLAAPVYVGGQWLLGSPELAHVRSRKVAGRPLPRGGAR